MIASPRSEHKQKCKRDMMNQWECTLLSLHSPRNSSTRCIHVNHRHSFKQICLYMKETVELHPDNSSALWRNYGSTMIVHQQSVGSFGLLVYLQMVAVSVIRGTNGVWATRACAVCGQSAGRGEQHHCRSHPCPLINQSTSSNMKLRFWRTWEQWLKISL